jgi:hypothetical protein
MCNPFSGSERCDGTAQERSFRTCEQPREFMLNSGHKSSCQEQLPTPDYNLVQCAGLFFPCASVAVTEGSRPISRVLSWTVIHLGCTSPCTSSNLPGNRAGHTIVPLFGLAPGGVFPATSVARRAVRSYRTISPLPAPRGAGGIFSVALSVGSRLPGVTWHPALWSPDFPPGRRIGSNCSGRCTKLTPNRLTPNRLPGDCLADSRGKV